ncbi:hypothetical protein NQ318_001650 [Aromia moschata]|uniref:Uncharacterized protein n=1 Tax=Aromia moschata TaxID=1265417 RepID=A0AAV8XZC7_9CUCU|nr:hypothetical protein NQ318_001650 [Aromia moschata]
MGHVRKVPSKRQAVVDDDTNLNLLLALEENPITPARQLARDLIFLDENLDEHLRKIRNNVGQKFGKRFYCYKGHLTVEKPKVTYGTEEGSTPCLLTCNANSFLSAANLKQWSRPGRRGRKVDFLSSPALIRMRAVLRSAATIRKCSSVPVHCGTRERRHRNALKGTFRKETDLWAGEESHFKFAASFVGVLVVSICTGYRLRSATEGSSFVRNVNTVPPVNSSTPNRDYVPVYKWGIHFSGDHDKQGLSVNAFIERAEDLRLSLGVSEEELKNSVTDLLKGWELQFIMGDISNTYPDLRNLDLRCGDKTRTQKQVCEIFNTKYPDRRTYQSTVSRIENTFREFGNVTDIPKSGRKRILDDEQKLDILLDIQYNPHKPTRQVAADNDVKIETPVTIEMRAYAYWAFLFIFAPLTPSPNIKGPLEPSGILCNGGKSTMTSIAAVGKIFMVPVTHRDMSLCASLNDPISSPITNARVEKLETNFHKRMRTETPRKATLTQVLVSNSTKSLDRSKRKRGFDGTGMGKKFGWNQPNYSAVLRLLRPPTTPDKLKERIREALRTIRLKFWQVLLKVLQRGYTINE